MSNNRTWAETGTQKFYLNTRNNFSTVQVTKHCNTLPREVMAFPSLETIKNHLDAMFHMRHVVWNDLAWAGRLDQMTHGGPFQPDPFCDCKQKLFATLLQHHHDRLVLC